MHGHHHVEHHAHAVVDYGRAFQIGIALNVAFVAIETASGFLFNSVSLLADAGHNLSDVFGLLLAWIGFRLARVKPTARFTYGFGSTTILASTLNGSLLLVAVGAIAWEAIGRFWHASPVQGSGMIWVAGIGVVINSLTAMLFFRGRSGDLNIKGAYLHMLADALVSIGVVVAGFVIVATGWQWVDPVLSLIVAVVILFSTLDLFRDSLTLLSHGVPQGIDQDAIRKYLTSLPHVESLHDLHIWALSTTQTALTVHLVLPEEKIARFPLSQTATDLRDEFKVDHATIQLETPVVAGQCELLPDERV
jgi:cobalt-zinc-cadmium efflux system protein